MLALTPIAGASAKLILEGVQGDLRENVLSYLSLNTLACDAPAWRVRRLSKEAPDQAREALEAYGYYTPGITVTPENSPDCWQVRIGVDPGPPVMLRKVDVTVTGEGTDRRRFERLLSNNPLRSGEQLQHAAYDKYKRSFFEAARQQGYFAAAFVDQRIDVYVGELAADITLNFATGPRYQFGAIRFEQDVVAPALVERFVDFKEGDAYDGAKVTSLYNALLRTGYFASVDVHTAPGKPPDLAVPVTVRLTAAKRQVYTAGVGYSTDIGPKLRAGYTNRRLNDRGHQLDISASVSPVRHEGGISYRIPQQDPRVEWLNFDFGYKYENTDSNTTEIGKVGVKQFRRLPYNWIETRFLDLSLEKFLVGDQNQRAFLVLPGISFSHTSITSNPRPRSGHRLSLKLSGTAEAFGSDAQFLQAEVSGKLILPAWSGARVLMRGELGATAKDNFRTLPASVRFFAGGDTSVRGYDYESLGPEDKNGKVIGGSHKLIGSVEFDQRVLQNWSVAAFVDSGNAFDTFSDLHLKTGVGAGIRWYSPLGPLRVDVAVPLASDAPDSYRIHVTLGPDL